MVIRVRGGPGCGTNSGSNVLDQHRLPGPNAEAAGRLQEPAGSKGRKHLVEERLQARVQAGDVGRGR
jgi:hypothetical protein